MFGPKENLASPSKQSVSHRVLAGFCLCVLGGILIIGLYPFTPYPRNQVNWVANSNAIHFGYHGFVVSSSTFAAATPREQGSFSVELWLEPARTFASQSILSFYTTPTKPLWSLNQEVDELVLRRPEQPQSRLTKAIYVDHAFRQDQRILIAVNSNPERTEIYIDGKIARISPSFGGSSDLLGQLMVGKEPKDTDSWPGQLWGLAIYNREFDAAAISRHFQAWTAGHPKILASEDPLGLYVFDERNGRVIRNQVRSAPDLYMPPHFEVVPRLLLQTPWREFHPDQSYYKDLGINIAGFIPLGLFFCSYFSARKVRRAALLTTILGLMVSLTIEILQAYIPTRDSGMTDVITNTLGTGIGAGLYQFQAIQNLLARLLRTIGLGARKDRAEKLFSPRPISRQRTGSRFI